MLTKLVLLFGFLFMKIKGYYLSTSTPIIEPDRELAVDRGCTN